MKDQQIERCFYCGAIISKNTREEDHFPLPHNAGGENTVACCKTCHDMKDRYPLDEWPIEWIETVIADMNTSRLRRETKLFLAKCIRALAEAQDVLRRNKNGPYPGDHGIQFEPREDATGKS